MNQVRVRYAPSPTGHLHVGSLRTALYNWLFARHAGGAFLVRIEDTDLERSKPEYTESILESLSWASMEPDEPVVIQSERIEEHKQIAQRLVAQGKAYFCYCTPEELRERLGESAAHEGGYVHYDGKCRTLTEQRPGPAAIRFKVPDDVDAIQFDDLIRGVIRFEREQLDDFIIVRSDGTPMYNFVVVVDDAAMNITHVLRGEDHISNTPKQILLYTACGYTQPQFAHFSLILGPDGHRLSKRHGATAVLEFKKEGFLAHALTNYLARLGWSHGDQELFTTEELIRYFTLEHMSKKAAIFDRKKLEWLNGMYIRALTPEEIVLLIERDVEPGWKSSFVNWSTPTLLAMIALYKERVKTLKELADELKGLHERPHEYEGEATPETVQYLRAVRDALESHANGTEEAIDHLLKDLVAKLGVPFATIAQPVRRALTGKSSSPSIAQLIALLSVEEAIHRIDTALRYLDNKNSGEG